MSSEKISIKSPEFNRLFKERSKLSRELEKSFSSEQKDGYIMNQWGMYVPEIKARKLLASLRQLMEVDDESESVAFWFSYAATLLTLNMLDEAEAEFKSFIVKRPEDTSSLFSLATISAKRGDFDEARRWADVANSKSMKNFHITEERIQKEYEGYQKILNRKDNKNIKLRIDQNQNMQNDEPPAPEPLYEKIATDFASALVENDFEKAHALLSKSAKKEWSVASLEETYQEMVSYFDAVPDYIEVTESMENWHGKLPGDIGWAYVSIACDAEAEAVTIIVGTENEKSVIRHIEWGRP